MKSLSTTAASVTPRSKDGLVPRTSGTLPSNLGSSKTCKVTRIRESTFKVLKANPWLLVKLVPTNKTTRALKAAIRVQPGPCHKVLEFNQGIKDTTLLLEWATLRHLLLEVQHRHGGLRPVRAFS